MIVKKIRVFIKVPQSPGFQFSIETSDIFPVLANIQNTSHPPTKAPTNCCRMEPSSSQCRCLPALAPICSLQKSAWQSLCRLSMSRFPNEVPTPIQSQFLLPKALVLDTPGRIPTIPTLGTWFRSCPAEFQPTDTRATMGSWRRGQEPHLPN